MSGTLDRLLELRRPTPNTTWSAGIGPAPHCERVVGVTDDDRAGVDEVRDLL
jgi:hypothetical protein